MQADHDHIKRLLKTARGQIDGILRMIDEDRYCIDISNQLLATQSILKRANRDVIAAHLTGCVRAAFASDDEAAQDEKIDEIVALMTKLDKNG